MVSIFNTTTLVCLFLTIFFGGRHLKCGVSGSLLVVVPTKVTVKITNRLTDRYLAIHCKDKNNDFGLHS